MSNSLPPSLLYFVIYNPTLKPTQQVDDDDDDAEEQAHVLFYTAKEHAVSKDRVLRQVGLAKALVNFSSVLGSHSTCESVHSQSRRMVMISPEPDYWIHACVDLSKTARPHAKNDKSKGKQRETTYDYHEASLHDIALRSQLQIGYEMFKITHGSFSSILSSKGKEALELQLERFFTVWSWTWETDKLAPFYDYFGVRIHPLTTQLLTYLDDLEDCLPQGLVPLVMASDHIVAGKEFRSRYPKFLPYHLLSLTPPPPSPTAVKGGTDKSFQEEHEPPENRPLLSPAHNNKSHPDLIAKQQKGGTLGKRFLAVPPLNVNMSMDVRKWSWPGYLTFGVGKNEGDDEGDDEKAATPKAKPEEVESNKNSNVQEAPEDADKSSDTHGQTTSEVLVDSRALADALDTDATCCVSPEHDTFPSGRKPSFTSHNLIDQPLNLSSTSESFPPDTGINGEVSDSVVDNASLSSQSGTGTTPLQSSYSAPPIQPSIQPTLSAMYLHFPIEGTIDTRRSRITYLRHNDILLALVPDDNTRDDNDDDGTFEPSALLISTLQDNLEKIHTRIKEEEEKISIALSSNAVQSVLQKSQYLVSASDALVHTSSSLTTTSWHLHEGRKLLSRDSELLELYSRRQNPQDWHLVKRGTDVGDIEFEGSTYMEIGRKEASLTDVDGELTGVLHRLIK